MTTRSHAIFIRNNRTPRMAPLREVLEGLGFSSVASFGSSGNFVVCVPSDDKSPTTRTLDARERTCSLRKARSTRQAKSS